MDNTVISAVVKAALRDQVAALSKALLNAQKAAAAGNKERAGREAVAAAQAAQATGAKFLALQVEVRVLPLPSVSSLPSNVALFALGTSGLCRWLRPQSELTGQQPSRHSSARFCVCSRRTGLPANTISTPKRRACEQAMAAHLIAHCPPAAAHTNPRPFTARCS